MKLINLTFGDDREDVDILSVPDCVCENIESITQEFFNWLENTKEHGCWRETESGVPYLAVETKDYVEWLNKHYCNQDNDKVTVVKSHVKYNPRYDSTDL